MFFVFKQFRTSVILYKKLSCLKFTQIISYYLNIQIIQVNLSYLTFLINFQPFHTRLLLYYILYYYLTNKFKNENLKLSFQFQIFVLILHSYELGCLGKDGKDVDWYLAIKGNNGFEAHYADVNDYTQFVVLDDDFESMNNPVIKTMNQLNGDVDNYQIFMGNDEPPYSSASSSYAHQKLVIAFDPDTKTGFYLLHSVPKWPYPDNVTLYDNNVYAQHHLCLDLDESGLDIIGKGIYVSSPKLYVTQYDEDYLYSVAPELLAIAQGQHYQGPANDSIPFVTRGGQKFQYFFKNGPSGLDIYGDMIAPYYKSDLITETWLRDSAMTASCGQYSVEMAQYVIFNEQEFKETQDHCKWCVSKDEPEFACFGDMNFQTSQFGRGGTDMCLEDEIFAQLMLLTIESLNPSLQCYDLVEQ